MTASVDSKPEDHWDEDIARELMGAIVLVGVTYIDAEERPIEQIQYYGVVVHVDKSNGVAIECHGEINRGETVWLPPMTTAFTRANPGTYRLRSTSEELVDPGFLTTWTITKPEHQPQ